MQSGTADIIAPGFNRGFRFRSNFSKSHRDGRYQAMVSNPRNPSCLLGSHGADIFPVVVGALTGHIEFGHYNGNLKTANESKERFNSSLSKRSPCK